MKKHEKKIMKVSQVPQGSGYVPGVRIAGSYLQSFGFNVDDPVLVTCAKNTVTITKATERDMFNYMAAKNPALFTLEKLLR